MNNIRHDHTSGYINDDEVNRQIGSLADMTAVDHNQEVIELQKKQYQELSDKYDAGEMTAEQTAELKLMHRINAQFQYEHHEDRWARQNALAKESAKLDDKMRILADKLRSRSIDESTYYDRWAKLKAQKEAIEREL